MDVSVERIILSIECGDQDSVQTQLDKYISEHSQCFFFSVEAKERRKLQELEEFRKNKVRSSISDSDSDNESEDLLLRRQLGAALIRFVQSEPQPAVLRACLTTLRILSRDRQALAPFVTDSAILTLARLAGITCLHLPHEEEEGEEEDEVVAEEWGGSFCGSPTHVGRTHGATDLIPQSAPTSSRAPAGRSGEPCCSKPHAIPPDTHNCLREVVIETCCEQRQPIGTGRSPSGVLARGRREPRGEREEEEGEECHDDGEAWRKEAMKALCNVIYNSQRAQERASALRLLTGLSEKLKNGIHSPSPPSGQFYDLRLLFLLTALCPELRKQLQQARGVSMLAAALEQCLEVRWAEAYEVVTDITAPPISKDVTHRAVEILKTLFNITYTARRRTPDEEDQGLYRHLVAILRHCLLLSCEEDLADELQGHVVNLLSVLPLECLDVLLSGHLSEGSRESCGVNMDSVQALLRFMERRLDRGHKLKEKLTPVLNLLTESSRAHRETRHYLKHQILPPLREVFLRPEQGDTLRNKLVRLMTHVDTDLKHCSAELLFVLCKENVSRFVKYTGFCNAAGLLAGHGILGGHVPSPRPQYSSDSDSDTEEYRCARDRINLMTGRVEEPQPDPLEGMSQEEREMEAMRLVSMFNRLSRYKIIQPMGITADGRLVPLGGKIRNNMLEEEEEEGGDEERDSEEVD